LHITLRAFLEIAELGDGAKVFILFVHCQFTVSWDGVGEVADTFKSRISLFFSSSSFLTGSTVSAVGAASPSVFLVSGSVEYHLELVKGRDRDREAREGWEEGN
jgi:hypothetical protein